MQKIAAVITVAGIFLLLFVAESGLTTARAAECDYLKSNIRKEHDLHKRRALYRQAIKLCQDDVQLRYSYAYELERFRKYAEALEQYKRVVELDPNMAKAYFNMGDIYKSHKQYSKAIESYKKGLRLDPDNTRVKKNLAEASKELDKQ